MNAKCGECGLEKDASPPLALGARTLPAPLRTCQGASLPAGTPYTLKAPACDPPLAVHWCYRFERFIPPIVLTWLLPAMCHISDDVGIIVRGVAHNISNEAWRAMWIAVMAPNINLEPRQPDLVESIRQFTQAKAIARDRPSAASKESMDRARDKMRNEWEVVITGDVKRDHLYAGGIGAF